MKKAIKNSVVVTILAAVISLTQMACRDCAQCTYTSYWGVCANANDIFRVNQINIYVFNDVLDEYRNLGYTCDSTHESQASWGRWMCGEELRDFESSDPKRICR